jgi:hypothetical protein
MPADNDSGKVTRGAVLAAALEIIDRDGAGALPTSRRPATGGKPVGE